MSSMIPRRALTSVTRCNRLFAIRAYSEGPSNDAFGVSIIKAEIGCNRSTNIDIGP